MSKHRKLNSVFMPIGLTLALVASACASSTDSSESASDTGGSETVTVHGIEFPKPERDTVKIGLSALDAASIPQYLIESQNLDEQFGMDVELVQFSGTSQVTQALLAGQIDAGNGSGGVAMATQATDRPAQIVFVTDDVLTDMIISQPDVRTADDLKGKAIAISSFGSQSHASAMLGLQALGLSDTDVTITQVGNDAARLSALKSGAVAAAILAPRVEQQLTDEGYHVLQKLTDIKTGGYVTTSLTVPETFEKENPNTVLALTALYTIGRQMSRTDVDAATEAWATQAEISPEEARHDVDIEWANPQHPMDGRCDAESINLVKEIAASSDDKIESINAQDACTNEYIDKLKEMGFQKAIGLEGY